MTNIEEIIKQVEWNCMNGFGWTSSKLTNNQVAVIIGLLKHLEKDAERYRWLSQQFWIQEEESAFRLDMVETETYNDFIQQLNKKIDSKLKKENEDE